MKLWVVGKVLNPDTGCDIWEFRGVFDTVKKAEAACRTENYFVGPVDLNFVVPEPSVDWPNSYYPLIEEDKEKE